MKGAWPLIVLWIRMRARLAILSGLGIGLLWAYGQSLGPPTRENTPPLVALSVFWGLGWMLIAGLSLGSGMSRGPGAFLLSRPIASAAVYPGALVTDVVLWTLFFVPLVAFNPMARTTLSKFEPFHPATWGLVFGSALLHGLGTLLRYRPQAEGGALRRNARGLLGLVRFAPLVLAGAFVADIQLIDVSSRLGVPAIVNVGMFGLLATVPLAAAAAAVGIGRADLRLGRTIGNRTLVTGGLIAAGLLGGFRQWLQNPSIEELGGEAVVITMGDRTIGLDGRAVGLREFVGWHFTRDLETGETRALPHLNVPFLPFRMVASGEAVAWVAHRDRWPWPTFMWSSGFDLHVSARGSAWRIDGFAAGIPELASSQLIGLSDDGELAAVSRGGRAISVLSTRSGSEVARFEANESGVPVFLSFRDGPWFVARALPGPGRPLAGSLYDPQTRAETPRFVIQNAAPANIRWNGPGAIAAFVGPHGLTVGDAVDGSARTFEPPVQTFNGDVTVLADRSLVWTYNTGQGVEVSHIRGNSAVRMAVEGWPARIGPVGDEVQPGVITIGVSAAGVEKTHLVDLSARRVSRTLSGSPLRWLAGRAGSTWTPSRPGSPASRLLRKPDGTVVVFDVETGVERVVYEPGPGEPGGAPGGTKR